MRHRAPSGALLRGVSPWPRQVRGRTERTRPGTCPESCATSVAREADACRTRSTTSWRHQKRGDLAQEMAVRSAKVAGVARTVVPVLDSAKEQATGEVAEWFRANVLAKLSSAMDREDKATVHAIRAESSASGPAVPSAS